MNTHWLPTLIIISLLIIVVFVFNVLAQAFDLTFGSYAGVTDVVHTLRDASNLGLPVFLLAWMAWEIQKRLNWPSSPKHTTTAKPFQDEGGRMNYLNVNNQTINRNRRGFSEDILRIRHRRR